MKRYSPVLRGLFVATALFAQYASAASVTIGNDPVPRTVSDGWREFVLKLETDVIPSDGVLTQWEVNAATPGKLGLLIWSAGTGCDPLPAGTPHNTAGTNCQATIVAVDERTVTPGLNTFTTNIEVQAGQTLGLWIEQASVYFDYELGAGEYVQWCTHNGCTGPAAPAAGSTWALPSEGDWHTYGRDRTYSVRATYGSAAPGIDIKPGTAPNRVNLRSEGVIPVAVLGKADFDVSTIDTATLRFGATGTEAAAVQHALEDVNADGYYDLITHFSTQETGLQCQSTQGRLTASTFYGQTLTLADSVLPGGPTCK
jgi:hypothetical protein